MKALAARLRALPWPDIGVAAAVVVVGLTQPLLSLIRENADYFPKEPWFHLGILAWAALLPFAVVLAVDLALIRRAGRSKAFAVWRAALYTFLFASALRQAQVYYPAPFNWFIARIPPRPVLAAVLALVFLLSLRSKVLVHRYVASLGLLAVLLLSSYVYASGLLGDAWRGSPVAAQGEKIDWKGDPVIIILFDELSNDVLLKDGRIDEELFPHFAALAADAAWFPAAQCNFLFTKESLPSMLTGMYLPKDRDPKLFDFLPASCAVLVRDYFPPTYGWLRRNARVGQICLLNGEVEAPLENLFAIPGVLHEVFQETPFSRSPFAVTPPRRMMPPLLRKPRDPDHAHQDEVTGFLASLRTSPLEGRLIFWHSPFPHFPFTLDADGLPHGLPSTKLLGPGSGDGKPPPPGYSHAQALENYTKQVRYCDRILGQIVQILKERGLYERTTLVVTSDHGLRTWGAIEPTDWPRMIAGGTARIPLMIRGPRVKSGVYPVPYRHVDFTPTVLESLGIPFDPARFVGVSGFAPALPDRPEVFMNSHLGKYDYDAARDVWVLVPKK